MSWDLDTLSDSCPRTWGWERQPLGAFWEMVTPFEEYPDPTPLDPPPLSLKSFS